LSLTLRRTGDAPADIRTLERLHALLDAASGPDPYEVELVAGRKRVRISNPDSHTNFGPELEMALRRLLGPENVVIQAAMMPLPPEEPADLDGPPFPDVIANYEMEDDELYVTPPSAEPSPQPAAVEANGENALVAARISGDLLPGESPLPGIEARRSWWSNED
jgi:hypothetical protein